MNEKIENRCRNCMDWSKSDKEGPDFDGVCSEKCCPVNGDTVACWSFRGGVREVANEAR